MKTQLLRIASLIIMALTIHTLPAAKFVNKTTYQIELYTTSSIPYTIRAQEILECTDFTVCTARITGNTQDYPIHDIKPNWSIIFAETNGKLVITIIET